MRGVQADRCCNPSSHVPSNIYIQRHVHVMPASQNAPVTVSTAAGQGILR